MSNRLINEKSPYLLSHSNNPVDWYPWGEEAFRVARERDVPVFISIGYSSCHWCHVMERESFMDEEVAKILNDNFVSIKIDREERPDIDHMYMQACITINGSGGWPLTVFSDYDKAPFYAGTYFPKLDTYRSMGLISLLKKITSLWSISRKELISSGKRLLSSLNISDIREEGKDLIQEDLFKLVISDYDEKYGGFGNAPKFPTPSILLYLLRYYYLYKDNRAKEILEKTLDAMALGGIFDHIGGGFFRYSTDRKWLVPHFEKMLYDNAMLMMVYAEASNAINPKYRYISHRIYNYLLREMQDKEGAFYTAQDADSEGVEGKFYLFNKSEILDVLGDREGEEFSKDYNITLNGNFEGRNIVNRSGKEFLIDDGRTIRLYQYRLNRIAPLKDDKILTSSNGLLIAALALSGRLMSNKDYIETADKAARFIDDNLFISGRLMARYRDGEVKHLSTLDDYAYLIWGYTELLYATNNPVYLDKALSLTDSAIELFSDTEGGFFLSGIDVTDMPIRQKSFYDGAVPSGNSVMCNNLFRLYKLTDNDKYLDYANGIINNVLANVSAHPYGHTFMLISDMERNYGRTLMIVKGEGIEEIVKAALTYAPFTGVLIRCADKDKQSIKGMATAYICDNTGCKPPITHAGEVIDNLK